VPALAPAHLEAIVAEVAAFPAARIRPIFDQMEKKQPGSGAMYSVVIDPSKCTGCLQCVEVCGPHALTAAVQTDEMVESMETAFARLTDLPNTPERFTADAALPGGDAKRIILDHDNYYALAGGHGACKGCGEVTATHLLTALAESTGKTKRQRQIADLETLIYQLTTKLDTVDSERADRLRHTIDELEKGLWLEESGPTGHGPAPMMVVNSTGCSSVYASTFPANPFTQPWLNSLFQDAQASALGVFEGLVSGRLEFIKARRVAALELADAYDPAVRDPELATLTWRDLTPAEIAELPLVVTISGDGAIYDIGFGAMSKVLTSQTPIKMLVLDTGVYSNTGGQASTSSFLGQNSDLARYGKAHHGNVQKRKELTILAALHPSVFVASVSTSLHAHFFAAAARALAFTGGSSIIHAYTPCGFEQGFADDQSNERAEAAVRSRMEPLFVHDPTAGATLPERISLDGNPEIDKAWATRNVKYLDESGKVQIVSTPFTPAEFAYAEVRFAKHFFPLKDTDPDPVPVADYVELPAAARAGHTPYILTTDADGALAKVRVSSAIVDLVEDRQANWQLLRFLAGRDAQMTAKQTAQAMQTLQDQLAQAQAERDQGIDDIAHALAALATGKSATLPSFGTTPSVAAAPAAAAATSTPAAGAAAAATPVASANGLGPKPAGVPIWLAEQDIAKCTDCATCYQELPAIFESTVIVVDGEAKNVSRMKPGALDGLDMTPELDVVMQRVKDTCDAEIIQ
jgi:pyruvate-ferredoxin/flavodoxin oxidoreductase